MRLIGQKHFPKSEIFCEKFELHSSIIESFQKITFDSVNSKN